MVACAPRYDRRLAEAILALDDRAQPIAETWRAVGRVADRLALPRPSYSHVLRILREERDRQEALEARRAALRAIAADVLTDLTRTGYVNAYEVADRVAAVGPPPR